MRPYGLDHKRVGEKLVEAQGALFAAMTDEDTQRAVIRADGKHNCWLACIVFRAQSEHVDTLNRSNIPGNSKSADSIFLSEVGSCRLAAG